MSGDFSDDVRHRVDRRFARNHNGKRKVAAMELEGVVLAEI
jgi:hypothetical protein